MQRLGLAALCAAIGMATPACVQLTHRDAFPVPAKPVHLDVIAPLTRSVGDVSALPLIAAGRSIDAYLLRVPGSSGVLIFYGGSGNQPEAYLQNLKIAVAQLGLDLLVYSYYDEGESAPTVNEARTIAKAVYQATVAQGDQSRRVFVMGHSLGAWFALDVAASFPVAGVILVGAETTAREDIHATSFWSHLVHIQADADAAQLDSRDYAPNVRSRTLVVSSQRDTDVPSAITRSVYEQLPAALDKRWLLLQDATHATYFRDPALWKTIGEYFDLKRHR